MVELTEEEWSQVKSWLVDLRVSCNREERDSEHKVVQDYYSKKSIEIREFLYSTRLY